MENQESLYFENLSKDMPNITELQNSLNEWNIKTDKIKSNFDFTIPNYILDEIIEQQYCHNRDNLYALINCAVINGNITLENAKRIKEMY